MKNSILTLFLCSVFFYVSTAQEKAAGPIIKEYGKVFKVENTDFKIAMQQDFKAVFDVMNTPEGHEAINPYIETAARFLNMHAQAGVPEEQLHAAIVVHNLASKDIMNNAAYSKKYGVNNPNADLIKALLAANVKVIFCGQSAMSRGVAKEDLIAGVQLSLSAMTALIQLQNENYRLIKF